MAIWQGAWTVPRSRNVKPGFFTNDVLAQCEYGARLLFIGLWTIADREGRLEDRPARIKALLFPFDRAPVEKWLDALTSLGFLFRYEVDGFRFIQIVTFKRHQSPHVNEPASIIPAPELSGTNPIPLRPPEYIGISNQESVIGISNQSAGAGSFEPPTVEEVAALCAERGNRIDAEEFVAFYESKGWKVGNAPMKNWRSAIVTWEKRDQHAASGQPRRRRAVKGLGDD